MEPIVDKDPHLNYEINTVFKKVLNVFLIPVLNAIPSSFQKYIKKTHKSAEEIIEHATTHQALEVLYRKGDEKYSKSLFHRFFHTVWFNTNNSKAVRNRLRLTKREIKRCIDTLITQRKDIHILSIASGSARSIIEVLADIRNYNGVLVSVTFLDKDPVALEYSKNLAKELDTVFDLTWTNSTVNNFFNNLTAAQKFNIIEMVGLVDYFDNNKTTLIFSSIFDHLDVNGFLVTANINHNSEQKFVTDAVGWKMKYRSAEYLAVLITKAGFNSDKMDIYYEPLKIHCVITASK